jgi:hypothetical protein
MSLCFSYRPCHQRYDYLVPITSAPQPADTLGMTPHGRMLGRVLSRGLAATFLSLIPRSVIDGVGVFVFHLLGITFDSGLLVVGPALVAVLLLAWISVLKGDDLDRERKRTRPRIAPETQPTQVRREFSQGSWSN